VSRSLISAEKALPGKNRAPPEAMKMLPLNSNLWPKGTPKFSTPMRMSSNSRILPSLMAGWLAPGVEPGVVVGVAH